MLKNHRAQVFNCKYLFCHRCLFCRENQLIHNQYISNCQYKLKVLQHGFASQNQVIAELAKKMMSITDTKKKQQTNKQQQKWAHQQAMGDTCSMESSCSLKSSFQLQLGHCFALNVHGTPKKPACINESKPAILLMMAACCTIPAALYLNLLVVQGIPLLYLY